MAFPIQNTCKKRSRTERHKVNVNSRGNIGSFLLANKLGNKLFARTKGCNGRSCYIAPLIYRKPFPHPLPFESPRRNAQNEIIIKTVIKKTKLTETNQKNFPPPPSLLKSLAHLFSVRVIIDNIIIILIIINITVSTIIIIDH